MTATASEAEDKVKPQLSTNLAMQLMMLFNSFEKKNMESAPCGWLASLTYHLEERLEVVGSWLRG